MIYSGILNISPNPTQRRKMVMSKTARRAYLNYFSIKTRCKNKNCKDYKYYGAKGIQIKMSPREFIGWWLTEFSKKPFIYPVVSRKDHSGHYEMGNIELQENVDNTKERNQRVGLPGYLRNKRTLVKTADGIQFATFFSAKAAAETLGVAAPSIVNICNGKKQKSSKGFVFSYC